MGEESRDVQTDHSSPYIAKIKNRWSCISTALLVFHAVQTDNYAIYWNICTYTCTARSVNLIKHSYCGCEELPGSNCDVGFLGDSNQLIVFHHIALSLPT